MNWAAGSLYWQQQVNATLWAQWVISTSVDGIIAISIGDIDGDDDNDIVACRLGAQDVIWFENTAGSRSNLFLTTPHRIASVTVSASSVMYVA